MEKSAFLHENTQFLFDIGYARLDLAWVSIGKD